MNYKIKKFIDQGLDLSLLPPHLREQIETIKILSQSDDGKDTPFVTINRTAIEADTIITSKHLDKLIDALPVDSVIREKHEFEKKKQMEADLEYRKAEEEESERLEQERVEREERQRESSQRSLFDEETRHASWQEKVLQKEFITPKTAKDFNIEIPKTQEKMFGGLISVDNYAETFSQNGLTFTLSSYKIFGNPILWKWKAQKK